ncbi:MAG: HU family DNA-binding protein, partial [Kiritimatiellae bacterium]|nr:HU family DNA-binding protein [Kiritimatiellia bacterium]
MPDTKPDRTFTKSRLIKELSWTCQLPQTKIKELMENLLAIAKREAKTTFVIPGLCKFEVVRRKPRKVRNPRTGETFMLPEREALRITAPRSLKMVFAKPVEPEPAVAEPAPPQAAEPPAPQAADQPPAAQVAPAAGPAAAETPAPAVETPAPAAETPAAAAETPAPTTETPAPAAETPVPAAEAPEPPPALGPDDLISFRCPRCRQEVEATGDMVGFETECPTCGNPITVPARSEPGTLHADSASADEPPVLRTPVVSSQEAESMSPEKLKGLTIRIDVDALGLGGQKPSEDPPPEMMVSFICPTCKQEIEASRDMVGETTACPNCGSPLLVPAESASNTLHGSPNADPKVIQAMKGRTMRIEMGEDFFRSACVTMKLWFSKE